MRKSALERLPTCTLDKLLQGELKKDIPNGDLVRDIFRVLEEREKNYPMDLTPPVQAALDRFASEDQRRTERRKPTARSWVMRAASMAAILCIMLSMVLPQPARAETWWEKLSRWTSEAFELFSSTEETEAHSDYVFKTDNPGLQEVYDAVVALGITEPVVPMWLPDGYELEECVLTETAAKKGVSARFHSDGDALIYKTNLYDNNIWHEYQKDDNTISVYETFGVKFTIIQNNGRWVVIWGMAELESSLSAVCDENTVFKIIDSIFILEE